MASAKARTAKSGASSRAFRRSHFDRPPTSGATTTSGCFARNRAVRSARLLFARARQSRAKQSQRASRAELGEARQAPPCATQQVASAAQSRVALENFTLLRRNFPGRCSNRCAALTFPRRRRPASWRRLAKGVRRGAPQPHRVASAADVNRAPRVAWRRCQTRRRRSN